MPKPSYAISNGIFAKTKSTTISRPDLAICELHRTATMSNYDRIKAECYEANLLLPEFKLIDLTFGNVSVSDLEQGVFAIKPSGVNYTRLSESDIVVIDMEGQVVEGALRPSSDTPTHRRLFQAFTGIRSIVHTHSRYTVSFAQAGKAIPCL